MRPLLALALILGSFAAHAQPEVFFRDPNRPVMHREEDTDRRFTKTRLSAALSRGSEDPNCAQLLGGLFTLLAEAAPTFHKRDENFYLDPSLVQALNVQLTNGRFPGNEYFVRMVRRVLIDGKMPEQWLHAALAVNRRVMIIDMGKLTFLSQGVQPVESFFFTVPALRQRYELEVLRANSTARAQAILAFRDGYLDREVAWGSLMLMDVGVPAPPKKPKGKRGAPSEPAPDYLVARLQWMDPAADPNQLQLFGKKTQEKPLIIEARLRPEQYLEVSKLPRGKRMLVRGRFWEMSDDLKRLELRDALLFEDRDWSQGAVLADPNAVAQCPLAINDLTGTAPVQPGGFGQRPGQPPRR